MPTHLYALVIRLLQEIHFDDFSKASRSCSSVEIKHHGLKFRPIFIALLCCSLFLLFFVRISEAQSPPPPNATSTNGWTPLTQQPGAPAGSYPLSGFDNINLYNGHLNFRLPLMRIGGRGKAGYTMMLPIEQNWRVETVAVPSNCGPNGCSYNESDYKYIANPIWWTGLLPGYGPGVLQGRRAGSGILGAEGCGSFPPYNLTLTRLTFTGPDGTEYELVDQQTGGQPSGSPGCTGGPSRGKVFFTRDGSAATFISDSDISDEKQPQSPDMSVISLSGYLMLRDGTRYRIDNSKTSWIRDTNGNKVSFTYSGNNLIGIDDALNRHVSITYSNPTTISFKGTSGATRTIKVYSDSLSNVLRKYPDGTTEYTIMTFAELFGFQNAQQGTLSIPVTSAVELPDGRQYQFRYDSYANLAQVILPTGGRIEYDWTTSGYQFGDHVKGVAQRVLERRTALNTTTTVYETKTTYLAAVTLDGTNVTVDTLDPKNGNALLGRSRHYFYGNWLPSLSALATSYAAWKEGREYQTESYAANGTTVLLRSNNSWQQRANIGWWTGSADYSPANDPRMVETTTTLVDTNQVSKTSSINPNNGAVGFDQYNNQTDVWEYDFGLGGPGPLVRHKATSFLTSGYDTLNPSSTSPNLSTTYHIRTLPTQTSIYDGGGTERARTTFEYDNYNVDSFHAALLDRANISGHDPSFSSGFGSRGNVTRVSNYLLPSTAVSAYSQYDIAGNVIKVIDPRSTVGSVIATSIGYDDNFGTPDSTLAERYTFTELGAQQTFAFPTQVTNALSQVGYTQYDYYLGQAINQQDFSGIISASYHNDPLDRPTQLRRAIGTTSENQATIAYDDVTRKVTSTSDQVTNNDNGLKRQSFYDGLGRTTETQNYEGGTNYIAVQTQYDGLGRAYKVSNPFRPWQSEVPIWTTQVFDTLGRIRTVTTPDNAVVTTTYSGNTVTVSDQLNKQRKSVTDGLGRLIQVYEDPASLNYLTSYAYDVLDNVTTVTQGSQTSRAFYYDSLKRLTSAANPESGTISYQYDVNGNLIVKTDARNVSAHFEYDVLNRVTRRWYNGSSSPSSLVNNNPALPTSPFVVGATDEAKYFYDTQTLPTGAPTYTKGSSIGRLIAQTNGGGSTGDYFAYDGLGRQTLKIQQTGSINYQMSASYNASSALTSVTYPSGRTISNGFDTMGRLTTFSGNLGDGTSLTYSSGVLYAPAGGLVKEQFGTTTPIYNKLFYNSRGQLSEIRESTSYTGPTDTTWDRGAIINHYSDQCWGMCGGSTSTTAMTDNNGNLHKQEVYIPGQTMRWQQYDYDTLNRLNWVREILDGGTEQWRQWYTYDRWGNRTINNGNTYGTGINNKAFSVDTSNNRLGVPTGQTGVMQYDAAGNLTNDTYTGAGNRTYDGENKITSAWGGNNQAQLYKYDASGNRVKRTVNGVETWQVYGFGGELLAEYPANGAAGSPQKEYGYRNGQLLVVAAVTANEQSLSLNGTSAYAQVPSSTSLSISGAITIEAWIKINALGAYRAIVSKEAFQQAGTGGGYRLVITDLGKVRMDLFQTYNTYTTAIGTATVTPGVWQHVAGVFDGSQMRLYLNGVLNGTVSTTNAPATGTGSFYLGRFSTAANPYYFNGLIDDARVSNAALYSANFTPATNLTASGSTKGLWKFNGQTVNDTSGNSNNGSLVGGGGYSSDVPGGGGGTSTQMSWLVSDQLGTPRMIFDQSGSLANTKRHDYLPFGEELVSGIAGRSAAQGYGGGDGVRQQFTQKERDIETGLDYFLARYYSSTQGRFTSPDEFSGGPRELFVLGSGDGKKQALPYAEITQPQSLNKYSYAYNSPCRYIDPDGHCGVPSGLKSGQVGICVASYIKTYWFKGIGRGDGRDTNGQGGTSRIEVRVAVDPSNGTVKKTDEAMGTSGLVFKSLGKQGSGGVQVSEPNKDKQGNVYFQINQHGDSAMNVGNFMGTIDNHLNMVVTPDNKVGITADSTARAFPSLEVYKYTMDAKGNITTTLVLSRPETDNSALKQPETKVQADPR